LGDRRIVVRNGAVADIIESNPQERANLARLEGVDRALMDLRARLRRGERIDVLPPWFDDRGKG